MDFDWNKYARLFDKFTFQHQKILLEDGLEFARGKVIDGGCGVGKGLRYLPNSVTSYVGVDSSPQMLDIARSKKTTLDTVFVESDLSSFPFENYSPDSIAFFNSLYVLDNPLDVLSSSIESLPTGGRLILANQGRKTNVETLLREMNSQVESCNESDYGDFLQMNRHLMGERDMVSKTYELEELVSLFDVLGLDIIHKDHSHFYSSCPLIIGEKK